MSELVFEFRDIQEKLEPYFAGKTIKVILDGDVATIFAHKSQNKALKARGIFNSCADAEMIQGEKGAWERAIVEKYAKDNS